MAHLSAVYGTKCFSIGYIIEVGNTICQVASSDTLFLNFYQMLQEKAEEIQTFAARLEGSLNKLRLRYPQKIAEGDVGKQLKDQLFYRMQKPLQDSVCCYIYDNPAVTYTQLMLAAHKAETEVVEPKTGKTVISKSATIENDKNGSTSIIEEMQKQFANIKSLVTKKGQSSDHSNGPKKGSPKDGIVMDPRLISKGPVPSAVQPFKEGQYPDNTSNVGGGDTFGDSAWIG